jgi:hypothetical protein
MLHAKAMAIVVAFDIYKELAEGNLDGAWKVNKPVDFYVFRETLARQMLGYSPTLLKYLGDEKFRVFTQASKARRAPTPPLTDGSITTTAAGISEDTFALQANSKKRLCGFLGDVKEHYDACSTMVERSKKLNCVFCGKPSYQFCSLCQVAVHKFPRSDDGGGTSCFFHWHDTACFGLARDDWRITNKKMKEWHYPTMEEMSTNEVQMKKLDEQLKNKAGNGVGNGDRDDSDSDNSI